MVAKGNGAFSGMETLADFIRLDCAVDTEKLNKKLLFIGIDVTGVDDRFVEFLGCSNVEAICTDD